MFRRRIGGVGQRDLDLRIGRRIARAGLTVSSDVRAALAAYVELLARWNARINLTAFTLSPASDEAVDRLIVEPLAAARRVPPDARRLIDVGSGGGSPALPLRIALPRIGVTLVESKVRKCAFLREAVRQLRLDGVVVENHRLDELLARPELNASADVVTIRAVRADGRLWATVATFLRPGGRVLWFTTSAAPLKVEVGLPLAVESVEALLPTSGSRLLTLIKTT